MTQSDQSGTLNWRIGNAAGRGVYIYQEASTDRWRWQVIAGEFHDSGDEPTYARARLRADNALMRFGFR